MARPKKPPRLEANSEGWYYAFWYDPEARRSHRTSLRTKDPVEAATLFAAFVGEGGDVLEGKPRAVRLTVRNALDDYLREHVQKRVKDKRRQIDIAANLVEFFGDTPLHELEIADSEAYLAARVAGSIATGSRRKDFKAKPSTVKRELVTLIAAINYARKRKRLPLADVPTIELPIVPSNANKEPPVLDREMIDKLLNHDDPEIALFTNLAYFTGGRRRSVEYLKWPQVDTERWVYIDLAPPDDIQRGKRRPKVPIDDRLEPVLQTQWALARNEWVFGTPRDMYRPFVEACEALGVKAWPHMLRHSRASHLLQDGVEIFDVARLLGDTVATTERRYGHHHPEHLKRRLRTNGQLPESVQGSEKGREESAGEGEPEAPR